MEKGDVSKNWQTPPVSLPILYIENQKAERVFGYGILVIDHRRKILFKYIFNIYFSNQIEFRFNTGSESGLQGIINTV